MCLHVQTTFQRGNNSSVDPGAANGNLDLAGLKAEDKTLVHQVQIKPSCVCTPALACLHICPRVPNISVHFCFACAQRFMQRWSDCADAAEVCRHRSSCSSSCQSQALGFVSRGGILSTGDCSPGSWRIRLYSIMPADLQIIIQPVV